MKAEDEIQCRLFIQIPHHVIYGFLCCSHYSIDAHKGSALSAVGSFKRLSVHHHLRSACACERLVQHN